MPRKSTDTDMTPFVDIAFLILSFFIMATKMKDPDKVSPEPPSSVGSNKIPEANSILISMDKDRVFFVVNPPKGQEQATRKKVIETLNSQRQLGLTENEMNSYAKSNASLGLPLNKLKGYLALPESQRANVKEEGIPVKDSATNELFWWVDAARRAFEGADRPRFLIKGDKKAMWPQFQGVVDALKRNDELKYFLVTSLEAAPAGSDLYRTKQEQKAAGKVEE